jgi:uncharacterized membrane protein
MLYLFLKVVHVVAVIIWIGAMVLLTTLLGTARLSTAHMKQATRIVEAGIGLVWLAGIALVLLGGWYTSTWWQLKVVLVIIVSAIHTITISRWRRLGSDAPLGNKAIPLALMLLTVAIVLLVVLKRPL